MTTQGEGRSPRPARWLLVQMALPHYRRPIVRELGARLGGEFVVLVGRRSFDPTIETDPDILENAWEVRNRFIARRLAWQDLPWRHVVQGDAVMLELNPRVASTWLLLIIRRLLGRRTVVWGHAWPRQGPASRSDKVRHLQRLLAHHVVVYTETQRTQLRARMPRKESSSAPNALYRRSEMHTADSEVACTDIVFVGRLVHAKKPGLLLDAFLRVVKQLPEDIRLVFVGDGPERADLQKRALLFADRVVFLGEVRDLTELRCVYATAIASASPGYVGLSITQSLGFGVPMMIAADEPHSPELEAAKPGVNAEFFGSDDTMQLGELIMSFARSREYWVTRRTTISATARELYSVETMADRLEAAFTGRREAGR